MVVSNHLSGPSVEFDASGGNAESWGLGGANKRVVWEGGIEVDMMRGLGLSERHKLGMGDVKYSGRVAEVVLVS